MESDHRSNKNPLSEYTLESKESSRSESLEEESLGHEEGPSEQEEGPKPGNEMHEVLRLDRAVYMLDLIYKQE